MLIVITSALATDLTWTCADLASPVDAFPWSDVGNLGARAFSTSESSDADGRLTGDCSTDDSCSVELLSADVTLEVLCSVTTCVDAWGGVTEERTESGWDSSFQEVHASSYSVVPGVGEGTTWSSYGSQSLDVWAASGDGVDGYDNTETWDWSASWSGVLDARWPSDANVSVGWSYRERYGRSMYYAEVTEESWNDGVCAWDAVHTSVYEDDSNTTTLGWTIDVGTDEVVVGPAGECGEHLVASVNGVSVDDVQRTTWDYAIDADGDGFYPDCLDCDDTSALAHPGASEVWYDGIDEDCSGGNDYDQDGDGDPTPAGGGGDCADDDKHVSAHAAERRNDGVDGDCDGDADEWDRDDDGYLDAEYGGDDCDDRDASVNPNEVEIWYDGVDQDCDGRDDDQDGDGVGMAADCDDLDSGVATPCEDSAIGGASDGRDPSDVGCGCGTDAAPGVWGWLALLTVRRRRLALQVRPAATRGVAR